MLMRVRGGGPTPSAFGFAEMEPGKAQTLQFSKTAPKW
jgi:hypothetical protein